MEALRAVFSGSSKLGLCGLIKSWPGALAAAVACPDYGCERWAKAAKAAARRRLQGQSAGRPPGLTWGRADMTRAGRSQWEGESPFGQLDPDSMGILLVVFLSELSTFEHFNDFLNTFNTDI